MEFQRLEITVPWMILSFLSYRNRLNQMKSVERNKDIVAAMKCGQDLHLTLFNNRIMVEIRKMAHFISQVPNAFSLSKSIPGIYGFQIEISGR